MQSDARETRFAAVAAFFAGVAWVLWAVMNTWTHGGLDAGAAAVGERLSRAGALLMVGWNLLLIPAALILYVRLVDLHPSRVRLATACGLASLLFWAYGGATHAITPALEVSYLGPVRCVVVRPGRHVMAGQQGIRRIDARAGRLRFLGCALDRVRARPVRPLSHGGTQTAPFDPLGFCAGLLSGPKCGRAHAAARDTRWLITSRTCDVAGRQRAFLNSAVPAMSSTTDSTFPLPPIRNVTGTVGNTGVSNLARNESK